MQPNVVASQDVHAGFGMSTTMVPEALPSDIRCAHRRLPQAAEYQEYLAGAEYMNCTVPTFKCCRRFVMTQVCQFVKLAGKGLPVCQMLGQDGLWGRAAVELG